MKESRPHRLSVRVSDRELVALERMASQLRVEVQQNDHVSYSRPARVSDVTRWALEDYIRTRETLPLEAVSTATTIGAGT